MKADTEFTIMENELRNRIASELYIRTVMLYEEGKAKHTELLGDLANDCIRKADVFVSKIREKDNVNKIKG